LGFEPEWRKLSAADYGDATTRQRFILMARSDRRPVYFPAPTHYRKVGNTLELFPTLKPWKAAREIIDWNLKGRSIFNRKKPLAPKTLARIYAGAAKFGWPEPFLVILRNHMDGQSVDQPIPTVAANGTHIGLAQPVIMNGRKGNKATGVDAAPVPTLDTKGGVWLAEPFILSRQSCGAPRSTDQPMPTQTAVHSPVLISPYYGTGSGETCNSAEEPLPTVTSKGRFGMVVAVTNKNGGPGARDAGEPLPTMTTAKGGEFALVMPVTHHDTSNRTRDPAADPLPTVTGANRGDLAFITAQFGERAGQAPRVHDLAEPAPVGVTLGNGLLIEPTRDFDILFRMLEPHELAAAMGFNTEETEYEFAGTKTEKIKQIGNAVSVSKMKACVGAILADAARKQKQKPDPMRIAAE
jgi:DNA (cytosine-5)-methyltransferase 1